AASETQNANQRGHRRQCPPRIVRRPWWTRRFGLFCQHQQFGTQFCRALVAALPIFLKRAVNDALELCWYRRVTIAQRNRIRDSNSVFYYGSGLTGEGALSSRHLVQHETEGEDVGSGIQFLAAHLLGRHVPGSAHGRSSLGIKITAVRRRAPRSNS